MDDKEIKQNESKIWINRIGPIIMSIAITVSTWFLNQAWDKITTLEQKVHQIEIVNAENSGNRFTSKDWNMARTLIDADSLAQERRITRLEESFTVIKDALVEIKEYQRK